MNDLTTIVGEGLAAWLGKEPIQKLLGPTFDYLGEGLKNIVKKRAEAIEHIFTNAYEKAGAEHMDPEGSVSPRVLRMIVNEGSFATDEVAIEYLGGVLASSRTEKGRDDRGVRIARIVDSLSTYQIRLHYLLYSTLAEVFEGRGLHFKKGEDKKFEIYVPRSEIDKLMDYSGAELAAADKILTQTLWDLYDDKLLGFWTLGNVPHLKGLGPNLVTIKEPGLVFNFSHLGVELFLWAFGAPNASHEYIFDSNFEHAIEGFPLRLDGAIAAQHVK